MAITARDLAGHQALGLTLAAGAQAADREIAWAHAIELADPAPYLAGGELVMTTGINLGADAAAQRAYVQRLADAGTAALAVDTGTTLRAVPAGVLRAGDELGIPVLAVPPSTPFIAITRVVVDALRAEELSAVQRVADRQQVLARATLRGGIPAVVAALADALSATVVVAGADGTALAGAGPAQPRLLSVLADSKRPGAGWVVSDGEDLVTVQVLRAAQPVRGHLAVRTGEPMSNADRLLLAHAVALVAIAVEKPARMVDAEDLLRAAVTRQLLSGPDIVDDGVLRYFGFDPTAEVTVAVLAGTGPVLTAQQRVGRLFGAGPYLMAPDGDDIVLVVPAAGSGQRLSGAAGGGVSRPVGLAELAVGAEQARTAARAGAGGGLTAFDELSTFGMLLGGRTTAELRVFAEPLAALRGERELSPTLAAYLRHNGQMDSAAVDLGIHRHTVRNRMRRIRALLGDELESADSRAQLWLAVKADLLLAERGQSPEPSRGGPLR